MLSRREGNCAGLPLASVVVIGRYTGIAFDYLLLSCLLLTTSQVYKYFMSATAFLICKQTCLIN